MVISSPPCILINCKHNFIKEKLYLQYTLDLLYVS